MIQENLMNSMDPSGQIVVVTGGTRGIGEGVARRLASAGYMVKATGFTQEELNHFKAQENIQTFLLDVTDQSSVNRLFDGVDAIFGLINCAGILQRNNAEFEIDKFQRTIEVNLVGTMRMCLAAKDALVRGKGSVVNTASMLSFFGSAFVPGYSASKGGVAQLTKSLAAAWATDGVRVNAVAPGWIETEMTRPLVSDKVRSESILDRTPMGRWGQPEDVAGVVEFLLSTEARFITGAVIPVDGGYLTV